MNITMIDTNAQLARLIAKYLQGRFYFMEYQRHSLTTTIVNYVVKYVVKY